MPHNYDYSVCSYIKRRKFNFFAMVFGILSILLVIFVADFISGKISGNGSILFGGKIKIASYSIYAVELGEYKDINSAQELATQIKRQGGAGYIHLSGTYHVFVSMYENVKDAEQVVNKLSSSGTQAKIFTINVPSIKFEYKGDQSDVVEAINIYKELYRNLYDMAVALDSGKSSIIKIQTQLKQYMEDVNKEIQIIENYYAKYKDENLLKLFISLNNIKELLITVENFAQEELAFTAKLKETYIEVIFIYQNLCKSI